MSKDNLEIERRFLLKSIPSLHDKEGLKRLTIHQAYSKDSNERFRSTVNGGEVIYHKCRKKMLSVGVFEEIESEITEYEFDCGYKNCNREINKVRYVFSENGLVWEIDEYTGFSLIIFEVELDDINQDIDIPADLKSLIIKEITGEKEFSNYSLSDNI